MNLKLYVLRTSHPARAALAMLRHKGLDPERVTLFPGVHPLQLRLAGFRGYTVPALEADGRRIQGSREISRFADVLRADPPLFPADPAARRAVEEAERWGDERLQELVRTVFRWGAAHSQDLRAWMARDARVPAPGVAAWVNAPVALAFAYRSGSGRDALARALAELPVALDHVDELIARETIGAEPPNAADFQIAASVRLMLEFPDLRGLVEGRPAEELARRLVPSYPGPFPSFLPADALAVRR